MQVTRTFTQRITLDNPFKAIDDFTLLGILRDKFTNKCNVDCFVTEVTRLIAKGDVKITQSHPIRGNIEVKFQISGIIMPPGYIATDCKVIGIESGGIVVVRNNYVCGIISMDSKNGYLKPDMIVPVRIIESKYTTPSVITASCKLFTHDEKWPAYHITSIGSPDINWRELYEIARAAAAEIADARFDIAKKLAQPVKTPGGDQINIEQLDGIVCLHPGLELSAVDANATTCKIIHCSKNEAIARILTDYIMYAQLIKFIGNTYNVKAATDFHKLYILALNNSKPPKL